VKSLIVRDKLDGKGGEGARPPVFLKSCFHPHPLPISISTHQLGKQVSIFNH